MRLQPGPQKPCAPNSSTKTRPEITGRDRERQIDQRDQEGLAAESNLAIAQAAATPNTRLSGTEIAATSSVSRIAASASGSAQRSEIGADAFSKGLDVNTTTSGSTTKTVRKHGKRDDDEADEPWSVRRSWRSHGAHGRWLACDGEIARSALTRRPSAWRRRPSSFASTSSVLNARECGLHPALQAIDDKEDQERSQQHDDGDRRRIGIVEMSQPGSRSGAARSPTRSAGCRR